MCPAVEVQKKIVAQLGNTPIQDIVNRIKPNPKLKLTGKTASIQRWLNSYLMNQITVDDLYGPNTHQALVKVYQYELNRQFNRDLVVDGVSGPKTDIAAVSIHKGARGPLMKTLQAFLFFQGYTLSVDSIFGNITEEMVRKLQRNTRLVVDGIPGKQTFKKLIRR